MNRKITLVILAVLLISMPIVVSANFVFPAGEVLDTFDDANGWEQANPEGNPTMESVSEEETGFEAPEGPNMGELTIGGLGGIGMHKEFDFEGVDDFVIWARTPWNGWLNDPTVRIKQSPTGPTEFIPITHGVTNTFVRTRVELNWETNSYEYRSVSKNGNEIGSGTGSLEGWDSDSIDFIGIGGNLEEAPSPMPIYVDYLATDTNPYGITGFVDGTVSDLNDNPIENATVTLYNQSTNNQEFQTSTDSNGEYEIGVESGSYRVVASKSGWVNNTKNRVIDGSQTIDFTLQNSTEAFQFRVSNYMDHSSTQEYKALFEDLDETRLQGVTNQVDVTSNDPSIISVNSENNTLIATSNVSVNNRTTITAEYVRDGQTFTDTQQITVANRTMENIEIMPPSQYIPAALGFGEEGITFGIGSEIQWVLLSVFIGSAAAWIARNEWVGVGIIIGTHVFFWVLGNISLGLTMVAVFYGLMAAYQLNKIPGRSDTNVGGNQDSPPPQPPQQ